MTQCFRLYIHGTPHLIRSSVKLSNVEIFYFDTFTTSTSVALCIHCQDPHQIIVYAAIHMKRNQNHPIMVFDKIAIVSLKYFF